MSTTRVIHTPEGFEAPDAIVHTRDSAQPLDLATSRVHQGTVRFTVGQDEAQQEGVARHVHSTAGAVGGSIIDTLTSTFGRPSVELEPGNPASRTDVRTAERMGVIKSNGRGGWEAVTNASGQQRTLATVEAEEQQAAQQHAQEQAVEVAADTAGIRNAGEDALWRAEFENVPEPAFRSTAAAIVKALVLGEGNDAPAQRLAQETGMEPADALAKVQTGIELNQRIVDRALAKVGLSGGDLEAFYDEVRSNPGRMSNAIQYMAAAQDVSQFVLWGREYVDRMGLRAVVQEARSTDTDTLARAGLAREGVRAGDVSQVAALQAAGFEVGHAADGTTMVRQGQGQWVSLASIFAHKEAPQQQRQAPSKSKEGTTPPPKWFDARTGKAFNDEAAYMRHLRSLPPLTLNPGRPWA